MNRYLTKNKRFMEVEWNTAQEEAIGDGTQNIQEFVSKWGLLCQVANINITRG